MKIFITADHHFNHENIIEYCKRPFKTVAEMNEVMIERWNKQVGKNDLVIHLGDFGLGDKEKIKEIRKKLNGTIILIKGNHDRVTEDFIVVGDSIQIGNLLFSHRPIPEEEIPKGCINVHGHIHEKESFSGINISVEKTNYEPILLEDIGKRIADKVKITKEKDKKGERGI